MWILTTALALLCLTQRAGVLARSAQRPPSSVTIVSGELGARIDSYLSRLEAFGFSGAILAARAGQILLAKGYGLADRDRQIPFTPDTVSSIGSITKQFTAAAILKLEMQGRLRVEDPISKYLPGVPADKAAITIHHLLTHTAGLRGDFGGRDSDPISRDELVARVLAAPLKWPVGERYEYSNEGFSLAGAIVERVSGQTYETFLREQLFKPAGMLSTGYVLPAWAPGRVARGYVEGRDWGTIIEKGWGPEGPGWYLKANGGLHSTIGDMYRWHLALEGEQVLSAAAKEKFFKPHVREGPKADSFYAYGWAVFMTPRQTRLVAHNGGNGVFFADFRRYVDEQVVIYGHSNAELSAIDAAGAVAAIVFGGDFAMPPAIVRLDPASAARLAGTYVLSSGEPLRVTADGERLKVMATGPALALLMDLAPPGSAPFADLEQKTRRIIEAGSKGDYEPVTSVIDAPPERVRQTEQAMWAQRRARFGDLRGVEILGTGRIGPATSVFARLDLERGSVYARFMWDSPDELAGRQILDLLPEPVFRPVAPTEFAAFNLRQGSTIRLRFEVEGGQVVGVALISRTATVTARKVG